LPWILSVVFADETAKFVVEKHGPFATVMIPMQINFTTLATEILILAKMDIKNPAPKIRDGIIITKEELRRGLLIACCHPRDFVS